MGVASFVSRVLESGGWVARRQGAAVPEGLRACLRFMPCGFGTLENALECPGKNDAIGTILRRDGSGSAAARRTYAVGVKSDEGFGNSGDSGVTAAGGGSGVTGG